MRYWVFTTKPEHFRMSEALVPGETLDWPSFSHFKFEVGDLVFFYASSPVLQMIGKLEIERTDLDFASEVDPRNDLRKWPRHTSSIPWLRLRVLQSAPVPFRPLQRGSLYYHTEFKPSPYPKLLHEREREYVLRAFDEATTYSGDLVRYEGGLDPRALERVSSGGILRETLEELGGGKVERMSFDKGAGSLTIDFITSGGSALRLVFGGVRRAKWDYEQGNDMITGVRLTLEDIYLLVHFDGADVEILIDTLRIG